jgi:hypothetical protein
MASQPSKINWSNFSTIVSVAILVGTELVGVAWATGWAVAGLFQLGDIVAYIFQGIFVLGAIAILVAFMRQAMKIEPIRTQG